MYRRTVKKNCKPNWLCYKFLVWYCNSNNERTARQFKILLLKINIINVACFKQIFNFLKNLHSYASSNLFIYVLNIFLNQKLSIRINITPINKAKNAMCI